MLEKLFNRAQDLWLRSRKFLDENSVNELFEKAKQLWIPYRPEEVGRAKCYGVDSGWQILLYPGFYFYGLQAVAVNAEGDHAVEPIAEVDIVRVGVINLPQLHVKFLSEIYEHRLAAEASEVSDYVMVDGSLIARIAFINSTKKTNIHEYYEEYLEEVMRHDVLFVSKYSSNTRLLDGGVGDIYYFEKASDRIGYTKPVKSSQYDVYSFYARVSEKAPALYFESTTPIGEGDVEHLIDVLHPISVNGYPASLITAHRTAAFPEELAEQLAECAGFSTLRRVREVLEVG